MGTFHHNTHELHGITVAVDTKGPRVIVGRVDTMDERAIVLLDVDVHVDAPGGASKADYLKQAAKFGTWKKHDRLVVPMADVASVTRLGDIPTE